jgi:hypothetical protein
MSSSQGLHRKRPPSLHRASAAPNLSFRFLNSRFALFEQTTRECSGGVTRLNVARKFLFSIVFLGGAWIFPDAVQVDDSTIASRHSLHHAKARHVCVSCTDFVVHDVFLANTLGENFTQPASQARPRPRVSPPNRLRQSGVFAACAEMSMFAMHPPHVMGIQPLNHSLAWMFTPITARQRDRNNSNHHTTNHQTNH